MNEETTEVSKSEIEKAITRLLEVAYNGLDLRKHKYSGYPTCDLIACFFGTEETLENRFFDIFNKVEAIPKEYGDKWDLFQDKKLKTRINKMLKIASNLKDGVQSDFDAFSEQKVISNVGLASVLLLIYGFKGGEKSWIEENKDKLVKSTELLLNNRNLGKGWPYRYTSDDKERYAHTLSTWLSILALDYVPEEIGNAITDDWEKKVKGIKNEVKGWLINNIHKENGHRSWSFRPEERDDYNPVATAQAILALYYTGVTDKEDDNIKGAIEYIKNNENGMTDEGEKYKTERLAPIVGLITHNHHAGIQHCLHALLKFGITRKDETIQNLLNKTFEIIPEIDEKDERDLSNCYAILQPLLLSLPSIKPMVLLDSPTSISEFESFVSVPRVKSIALIGEIDDAYAKLIPDKTQVTVFCRPTQEKTLLENYGWESNWIGVDRIYAIDAINCIIVDGRKAILSCNPFKDMRGSYNFYKYLEGDEVSDLIKQIEEIAGIEMPISGGDIKQEILDKLSGFPKHCEIVGSELEKMETEGLQGILEYVSLNPKYAEGAELASALGLEDRESVERELGEKGVFSRVFVNSELKNLMERSMTADNDGPLVLDESSAYLILNCGDNGKEILRKCLAGLEEFYVISDIYDKIKAHLGPAHHRILHEIKDEDNKYIDVFESIQEALPNHHFNENEKIEIGFIIAEGRGEMGIITNSWEVARACKENNIRTFSLMKFLDKDEDIYKLFRIPVDEIAG